MKNFTKSVLNYFAAYTETRFRFNTRIDYKWTDDILTAELSVYPEFQKKILSALKNKEDLSFPIRKGEYSVTINEEDFKNALLSKLEGQYNLEFLRSCIDQEEQKLTKIESDKLIIAGDKEHRIELNANFKQKALQEGIRKFNLAFRRAIQEVLQSEQKEKVEELKREFNIRNIPLTSFSPRSIDQQIYDSLQNLSQTVSHPQLFYNKAKEVIKKQSFNLTMFDLYATLRRFNSFIGMGTPYLFFHEMYLQDNNGNIQEKYPIFLIEVDLQEKPDEIVFTVPRKVLLVNTPAINSFKFDHILTIPRAALLSEIDVYLWGVERFLQNSYNFFNSFLLEYAFSSFAAPNLPVINYRIGLQVVRKENKKLLDYSELITRIDVRKSEKLVSFLKDYVSGNVQNTTDEVEAEYNKKYPKRFADRFLSTIPLSLNKSQKRILTAIENPKNKVIVVDGPPGTGKSYTIAAITYWANQNNKSIVITSHKKAALDVIDNILTERFRKLHPKAKPPIMRITEDQLSINIAQNTLSSAVISSASSRANEFNKEAVEKDIINWREILKQQINSLWNSSQNYPVVIKDLLRFEELEHDLKNSGILKEDFSIPKIAKNKSLSLSLIKSFLEKISDIQIDRLSEYQIISLYEKKDYLDELISTCNYINKTQMTYSVFFALKQVNYDLLEEFSMEIAKLNLILKENSLVFTDKKHLKIRFRAKFPVFTRKERNIKSLDNILDRLNDLKFADIISNILLLSSKEKAELTLKKIENNINFLKEIEKRRNSIALLYKVRDELALKQKDIKYIFDFLSKIKPLIFSLEPQTIESLTSLKEYFLPILEPAGINLSDLKEASLIIKNKQTAKNVWEYIELFVKLSQYEQGKMLDLSVFSFYYESVHKYLEYLNDKRIKNLNKHSGDVERILVTLKNKKRLTKDQLKVLLNNIPCIIAEPDLISQYFPMEEDVIDILVIDEASQVSIAESISLILRAKQVVVFGDELQYGAVSATNVNAKYAEQYFKEIIDSYQKDFNIEIDATIKQKIAQEVSKEVDEEEQEVEEIFYKPEEGTVEWLKTFSIRTSTLSFAKAIKNYSVSLDTHFRSFPEIIDYSNEFFYKPSQIPLIVNRIRTKPINEVLRFIKVETQGNSGMNVNLDEIEAIKKDIQEIISNGYKGTIGIITSFREQKYRMEEILQKELSNYHILQRDHKLSIWFVGDVQGEERDIVYYSFVEDKKIGNGSLRNIYPIIGGSADNIRKLKMQRLNVGFSRAKDTMVFVHSMPIEEYSDTRLGDALKHYKQLLESANDNFIEDESVFDSPAEKALYQMLINTDFYKKNRSKIKIIAQFPIGKYIEETLHKYIPKYRVDFLLTLSERGKEKSLIIEYDGLEYHTKNPEIVTEHNFSQEYLDYDIERQLELESYGYKFLRINKFTILPKEKNQRKIDVLNSLLKLKFKE